VRDKTERDKSIEESSTINHQTNKVKGASLLLLG
jgi:hypothetical protein